MNSKSVLILEDDPVLRGTLHDGLLRRGFTSIAAASAEEAWLLLADVPDLDVALLDIRLGDGPIPTGLDFGLELKHQRREWPPEFLILSAYETPNYYQTALTLGAAAYLTKGTFEHGTNTSEPPKPSDIVARHVRALALRRALQSERPEMSQRVRAIAEESSSRDEAVARFCRDVLAAELEATLGRDYVVLLTIEGKTAALSGRSLPLMAETVFARLQHAIHARLGQIEPFIVELGDAPVASFEDAAVTQRVLQALEGAAFIALGEAKSFQLSLGVLPGEQGVAAAREQVKLIDHYLQKRVVGHLVEITELWSDLELERRIEAKKREVLLTATSYFCLYQGQEMQTALWETERNARNTEGVVPLDRLRTIAAELRDAGEILTHFASAEPRHPHHEPSVDMKQLVERIWNEEVSPRLRFVNIGVLHVDGRCIASDEVERAERAVAQILGWLGRRLVRYPGNEMLTLSVACRPVKDRDRVEVIFEERISRRLPRELRKSFFEPFYTSFEALPPQMGDADDDPSVDGGRRLGLYLAQTLAEMAGGALSDRSDDLAGTNGHRFILELPAARGVA